MGFDVHHVPGRIRFKIPGLRDSETLILALPRALQGQSGVQAVETRLASNSLIVQYHPARLDRQTLVACVETAVRRTASVGTNGFRPAEPPPDRGVIYETARHLGIVFGQAAFKAALEQAVRGGISALYRGTLPRL